jgi:TrmH family RNA methyltransferase
VKLLGLARDLRRRKARERRGLFVAEGVRAVEALCASSLEVIGALVLRDAAAADPRLAALLDALHQRDVPTETVGEAEFRSAADTESPQGVLAIGAVPSRRLDAASLAPNRPVLLLDGLQDPGNVGTIVRTAAAFGAAATLALPGTVDLWNAKVVRSAMGALFDYPALPCTWDAFDAFRSEHDLALWGADARGAALDRGVPRPRALALVIGNEGAGLSAEAQARVGGLVALPISGAVESLNAAVAAGIFLYELTR